MVPASLVWAQTLSWAHSCDGSPRMEAMQRQSQLIVCWHRHLARPMAVMGHNICR